MNPYSEVFRISLEVFSSETKQNKPIEKRKGIFVLTPDECWEKEVQFLP